MEKPSKDLLEGKMQFNIKRYEYTKIYNMPLPHYHEHYEILYIPSGKRRLIAGGGNYILSCRSIALIKPYVLHRSEGITLKGQHRILVNFTPALANELKAFSHPSLMDCFHIASPCVVLTQSQANVLNELFVQLLELPEETLFTEYYKKIGLCELLILLSNITKSEQNAQTETMSGRITDVARYLELHYRENLTLERAAEEFYVSPCYLSRCFKKYMGISFVQYLNHLRIISARRILEENRTTVTEAALQSGFENITHFERVFRSLTGIAPKQYQLQFKK